jgi:hypothetical protein
MGPGVDPVVEEVQAVPGLVVQALGLVLAAHAVAASSAACSVLHRQKEKQQMPHKRTVHDVQAERGQPMKGRAVREFEVSDLVVKKVLMDAVQKVAVSVAKLLVLNSEVKAAAVEEADGGKAEDVDRVAADRVAADRVAADRDTEELIWIPSLALRTKECR